MPEEFHADIGCAGVRVPWGELYRLDDWGDSPVELMVFEKGGSYHTHEEWEVAVCLSGLGRVVAGNGVSRIAEVGDIIAVPPGVPHRMVPNPKAAQPYRWAVMYSPGIPHLSFLDGHRVIP